MEEETRLLVERFEQPVNNENQDLGKCQWQFVIKYFGKGQNAVIHVAQFQD
jgi:hypothetical protein